VTYRSLLIDGGLAMVSWSVSGKLTSFVRLLLEARTAYEPSSLVVAWDCARELGWRRALSPAYKAKRKPTAGGFGEALAALRADLPALDVAQASAPGCEADDVLHSLATTRPGPSLILSGDKDMIQAIRPGVDLLKVGSSRGSGDRLLTSESLPGSSVTLQGTAVRGLTPEGWADLLALAGDPVDGVPGLRGVGPKKAVEVLMACPSFVRDVLDRGEDGEDYARRQCAAKSATTARWVERAIEHREELRLSRELVRLRLVEVEIVDAEPDPERAREVLESVGLGRREGMRLARDVADERGRNIAEVGS